MSSVGNAYQHETLRSYLTTRAFNNDFFTYTQSQNATTYAYEYTLAANITGANSTTCPAGRFLRETGRKLLPGANGGVNTLMVGVYDPVTGFSGFIDPNSEAFTIMNTDKSANIETIVGGANSVSVFGLNPNGSTSDLANPVYTRGDVIALGAATITGDIVSSAGAVYSNLSTAFSTTGGTAVAIDLSTAGYGNFFTISAADGFTLTATGLANFTGCPVYIKFINTDVINSSTVTLGSGIRENTGAFILTAGATGTMSFICDGTSLLELSRALVVAA